MYDDGESADGITGDVRLRLIDRTSDFFLIDFVALEGEGLNRCFKTLRFL